MTCVWTTSSDLDSFWATAPRYVVCKCDRCYDAQKDEPREYDYIFEPGDKEYEDLKSLLHDWIPPTLIISNYDHGEQLESEFEQWVRTEHPAVYRIVGRDASIFSAVLMEWWMSK